jgi:hypothetical protein
MKFALIVITVSSVLIGCNSGDNRATALLGDSAIRPVCSDNAAVHDENWGWENDASCRFDSDTAAAHDGTPECSANAVNHGDGWGWENDTSCRWGDSTLPGARVVVACSSDAVDHGDGWGWENEASCRWSNAISTQINSSTATTGAATGAATGDNNQTPVTCSANALDTGNGWGWEYGAPCKWGNIRPASNQNATYVPEPVQLSAEGYVDGKPICLTDASDGNYDGFGYENNQTCTVVNGRTATADNPLLGRRWCEPWAEISYGDYVLQNNTWNDSEVYSDRWHQCIELRGTKGSYVAKWDYNWLGRTEGNEYSVKSYPQVYYGRKTRNTTSGSPEKLGLPAPLNNIPDYKVRFKYSETGNPERNVALESFFHTSCEAEEWNKQFELMVWVGVPVTKTPGPRVAEVTIDGVGWDVHTNPKLGWGYVAFVAQEPMTEGWLDWNKFVDWTRFNGPAFGVPRIQNGTCMGAIEIGTETFWGKGTFTLHEFRVSRQ